MQNNLQLAMHETAQQTQSQPKNEGFEVGKYVNVRLLGCLDASIRIYVDPEKQKGMNQTQKSLHKKLNSYTAEQIEAALKDVPIQVVSVKDATGSVDDGALAQLDKLLASK